MARATGSGCTATGPAARSEPRCGLQLALSLTAEEGRDVELILVQRERWLLQWTGGRERPRLGRGGARGTHRPVHGRLGGRGSGGRADNGVRGGGRGPAHVGAMLEAGGDDGDLHLVRDVVVDEAAEDVLR